MDAFAALGTGIKFNKRRFQEDVNIFQTGKQKQKLFKVQNSNGSADVDFFAMRTSSNSNSQLQKDDTKDPNQKSQMQNVDINENSTKVEEDTTDFASQEEVSKLRNQNRIRVYGSEVAHPFKNFSHMSSHFDFNKGVMKQIKLAGYSQPTPIQMQAIPIMLSGRDLIACAPTGSGKTVAFVLPTLQKLKKPSKNGIRAVIVSPTRELAQQIYREFVRFAPKEMKVVLLSKSNVGHTDKKYDIIISTPLRIINAIKQEQIKLDMVQSLIVDEADKLFELNFVEQLDEIIAACTLSTCQKCLFSATINSHVETLAKTVMKDPIRIVIGGKNSASEAVDQQLVFVGQEEGKLLAVRQLVQQGMKPPVLIFVDSIERAKELFEELVFENIHVDVIHSDRTVAQRDNIVKNFRAGKIWVLIATELLGRGLDFKGVNLVINYDFPRTLSSYIHRIGRTGRAGRKGKAITYFTREDAPYLKSVANVMKEAGCKVPEWMLSLPKSNKKRNRKTKKETDKTPLDIDEEEETNGKAKDDDISK